MIKHVIMGQKESEKIPDITLEWSLDLDKDGTLNLLCDGDYVLTVNTDGKAWLIKCVSTDYGLDLDWYGRLICNKA